MKDIPSLRAKFFHPCSHWPIEIAFTKNPNLLM